MERIEEKYIVEYIRDMINSSRLNKNVDVKDYKYHHNTKYQDTPSCLTHGILSQKELAKLRGEELTDEQLYKLHDDGHVNGSENISLSIPFLDDLYDGEEEYNPFIASETDILISKNVKAGRSSNNYGNEFLAKDRISPKEFRSVDFRLLKYIIEFENSKLSFKSREEAINNMILYYNSLRLIAKKMKTMDIPLREMSEKNITLDIDKVSKNKELILK